MKWARLSLGVFSIILVITLLICAPFPAQRQIQAGPVDEPTSKEELIDPPIIKPAPENEWTPGKMRETGKVEGGLLQIVPPAQSLKSVQPAPSKQEIKPELRLPLEQPSLNVNPTPGAQLKVESQSIPVPILEDPRVIAVPPAKIENPSKSEPPVLSDPPIVFPVQPKSGIIATVPVTNPIPLEESPMMTKKLLTSVVLGAAILAAPMTSTARADEKEDLKLALERLEKVVRDLKTLDTNLSSSAEQIRQLKDEITTLKTRISFMGEDIRELRNRVEVPSSTSKRIETPSAIAPTANLKLVNDFVEEMSIIVNGRSYRLMPGERLTVPVPSGAYSYQILQLQRFPQERIIGAGETKFIRVFPQQ